MRKINNSRTYKVQTYGMEKTFSVPYVFRGYDFFAVICGICLIGLSSYVIIGENKVLNVVLKLVPGVFGAFLAYSTLLNFLNFKLNFVKVSFDKRVIMVQRLWTKTLISFDEIMEFVIQVEKMEGIVDSKGTHKGADTLSCNVEICTNDSNRLKLLSFPPFHSDGNESKLVEKIKKEGMSFIKDIGVSKPVSWGGVVMQ